MRLPCLTADNEDTLLGWVNVKKCPLTKNPVWKKNHSYVTESQTHDGERQMITAKNKTSCWIDAHYNAWPWRRVSTFSHGPIDYGENSDGKA